MKHFNELQEGVYDPNIFKAFFIAGGPGSGKSFVVRKTTGGLGLRVVNSDDAFENQLKKANLSLKMPADETEPRDVVRDRAKQTTASRKSGYIEGRLGIIIDGTGRDFNKITKEASELQQLGYDTYMIYVNTSLDVALERNAMRPRSIPTPIVTKSWNDVQKNLGKFSQFFRQGLVIVDNNDAGDDVFNMVSKQIRGLVKKKVKNGRAMQWIRNELDKKKRR
jgi:cytidylate kinase